MLGDGLGRALRMMPPLSLPVVVSRESGMMTEGRHYAAHFGGHSGEECGVSGRAQSPGGAGADESVGSCWICV
jgi:hypothetical protein